MFVKKIIRSKDEMIKIADAIAGKTVTIGIDVDYHKKLCDKYRAHIAKKQKDILAGTIPWVLSLPAKQQELGVSITALYLIASEGKNVQQEMLKSPIIKYVWDESIDFFATAAEEKVNGTSLNKVMGLNSEQLNLYELLLPAFLGDRVGEYIPGWDNVKDEYQDFMDAFFKPDVFDITVEERTRFLKNKSVAGKGRSLREYKQLWDKNRETWIDGEHKTWKTDRFADPFYILAELSSRTGYGLFGTAFSRLITKQENADLVELLWTRYLKPDGSHTKGSEDIDSCEFDTDFCFVVALNALMKDSVELQKACLRERLEKKSVDKSYVRKIEEENTSLHSEVETLRKRVLQLEKSNHELYDRYAATQNRLDSLRARQETQSRGAEAEEKVSDSNTVAIVDTVGIVEEPAASLTQQNPTEEDVTAHLREIFEDKKVFIVGGNPNLINKFALKHPNVGLIDRNRLASCDLTIRNASAILFKTDSLSHTLYKKCKAIAISAGVPIFYIPETASVPKMELAIYNDLTNYFEKEGLSDAN